MDCLIHSYLSLHFQNVKPVREAWMTELPEKLTSYGLGPRTFRRSAAPEKDKSWTETPEEKRKRVIHR